MNWSIRIVNEALVRRISERFDLSPPLAKFLVARGFSSDRDVEVLLKSTLSHNSPFMFSQMEKAVDRIVKAIKRRESILIFGDYDVDGLTSTTILFRFLRDLTDRVEVFIPHRLNHGYGLTVKALGEIDLSRYSLIITVDCGTNAFYEANLIRSKGIDLIVTDHHEVCALIPPALAIINPKLDDSYPFRDLAGCGVTFKLVEALVDALNLDSRSILAGFLPYVAIGTIGDSMRLLGENRFLVKYGLKFIRESIPLSYLIDRLGMKGIVGVEDVSYYLAPRINAPGRMDSAVVSLEFLIEDDPRKLEVLVEKIEEINLKRQREQSRIFSKLGPIDDDFYYIYGEDIHPGLVGVIAGRLSSTYRKPAFVISVLDEYARGSARVDKYFEGLYDVFKRVSRYLVTWGGHENAVGFTLRSRDLESFRDNLRREIGFIRRRDYETVDAIARFEDMDVKFAKDLIRLQPFGEGFEEPLFLFEKVEVRGISREGWKRRVKLMQDLIVIDGISEGDLDISYGLYDIVGSPYLEDDGKVKRLVIKIRDARRL